MRSLLEMVPVARLERIGPLHDTAGLPGYPARDFFAPAASQAFSPITGSVVKVSGHDPRSGPSSGIHGPFGWSVYIANRHEVVYITHLGSRTVYVGERLARGDHIGTVGDYARFGGVNHLHVGLHRLS